MFETFVFKGYQLVVAYQLVILVVVNSLVYQVTPTQWLIRVN